MRIGIPKEIEPGERRVAGTPLTVERLVKAGFEVCVQRGAGADAEHFDDGYTEVGGTIVDDVAALWATSDLVLKVNPPAMNTDLGVHEADMMKEGAPASALSASDLGFPPRGGWVHGRGEPCGARSGGGGKGLVRGSGGGLCYLSVETVVRGAGCGNSARQM